MYNRILPGLLLIVSVLFAGCAVSTGHTTQSDDIYHPKLPQDVATMDAAEQELAILLKETYWVSYGRNSRIPTGEALRKFVENKEGELGTSTAFQYYDDGNISCRLNGIGVSDGRLAIPIFPVYFDELAGFPITVVRGYVIEGLPHKISISFKGGQDPKASRLAQRAADLLFFVQQNWEPFQKEQSASFEKKAVLYRTLHTKPAMSEEQRKYIVQANAFNERKDYGRAIDLYQKAIEVDPISYPPAYFNLALLSAQTQRFRTAIRYMKQYLLLVPDAKDARSGQDKIYEWEAITGK